MRSDAAISETFEADIWNEGEGEKMRKMRSKRRRGRKKHTFC
jgi:hypothetical protein